MQEYIEPATWVHASSPPQRKQSQLDCEVDNLFITKKYEACPKINSKVAFIRGDITKVKKVAAIVNAARPSLLGGGGVDGAIHKAAGLDLLEACKHLGGCLHGEAKITHSFNIAHDTDCKVGPNRDLHDTKEAIPLLEKSYLSCLKFVSDDIRSVAFSSISTGAYRFPNREAGHIALRTIRDWLETNLNLVDLIVFCVFTSIDEDVYHDLMPIYFPKQ